MLLASEKYLGMLGFDGEHARDTIVDGARLINMSTRTLIAGQLRRI